MKKRKEMLMENAHIIETLQQAYDAFRQCDFKEFRHLLTKVEQELESYPKDHPLQGELLLIESMKYFSEPEKLVENFKTSLSLIGGRSKVLIKKQPMSLDFYNVFGIYYRTGRADEIAEYLDEATLLFEKLTGGGPETALCYRAQLSHYRGDQETALMLAEDTYHMALKNGNHLTALCAAELIGRIAQHKSIDKLWHRMQYYIDGVINNTDRRKICHEVAETIKAQSNMTLGIFKDIPSWIKNGDFGAIPQKSHPLGFVLTKDTISSPLLCHAGITHMEYLFYHKKHADAINMAHLLKDVWNASPQPFGSAYIDFLVAGNFCILCDLDSAHAAITSAIEKIAPDGLWLIPSEFILTTLGSFILDTVEKFDPSAVSIVQNLGIEFWDKLDNLRKNIFHEGTPDQLNSREYEVALLASDRLTNSEIAQKLFITESTVKFHLSNIFGKLGIKKRKDLGHALETIYVPHTPPPRKNNPFL